MIYLAASIYIFSEDVSYREWRSLLEQIERLRMLIT
jgi:hypothetical protein